MINAQLRKVIRGMMRATTSSRVPAQLHFEDNPQYLTYSHLFNDEAKEVFKTKAISNIHQYDVPIDERYVLYGLIELASLLGVQAADLNPCVNMFQRRLAKVRFFGFLCEPKDLDEARVKLINIINDMASNKWLIASLYNLGTMELANDPLNPSAKKILVFSYLAVKPEFDGFVDRAYSFAEFTEGGLPPEFK